MIYKVDAVLLEFFGLDFVVVVSVDRSENSVHKIVVNWQVDMVLLEKALHEVAEFLVIESAVLVFVELDEEFLDFLVQGGRLGLEVF